MINPGVYALFAWQSGWVFTLRTMQLANNPEGAVAALTEMVVEKQKAFTDGAFAASRAALQGASAEAVAAAALRPARRRVSANMRALNRKV